MYRSRVETRARVQLLTFNKAYGKQFVMPKVEKVVNITYWFLFNVICLLPLFATWCCRCCCRRKKKVAVAVTSSSAEDVKPKKE